MQILELGTGNISLEFRPDEGREVFRRLEKFGKVARSKGVVHDLLKIGDVELIYYFEWDEPCLIANSTLGNSLLRKLAANVLTDRAA